MKTKLKKWKKLDSEILYQNKFVKVSKDVVLLPNGKTYDYYINDKGARAVAVIAVDQRGNFLLCKEYRYPVNEIIFQSIGGGVEKGETPVQAARRELREEGGYTARSMRLLGRFYANPARSGTVFYAFLARGLRRGRPEPEEAEFIEHEFVTEKKLQSMLKQGQIKEPYFMAAYLLYTLKKP